MHAIKSTEIRLNTFSGSSVHCQNHWALHANIHITAAVGSAHPMQLYRRRSKIYALGCLDPTLQ
jgi:hypothetical protein